MKWNKCLFTRNDKRELTILFIVFVFCIFIIRIFGLTLRFYGNNIMLLQVIRNIFKWNKICWTVILVFPKCSLTQVYKFCIYYSNLLCIFVCFLQKNAGNTILGDLICMECIMDFKNGISLGYCNYFRIECILIEHFLYRI